MNNEKFKINDDVWFSLKSADDQVVYHDRFSPLIIHELESEKKTFPNVWDNKEKIHLLENSASIGAMYHFTIKYIDPNTIVIRNYRPSVTIRDPYFFFVRVEKQIPKLALDSTSKEEQELVEINNILVWSRVEKNSETYNDIVDRLKVMNVLTENL